MDMAVLNLSCEKLILFNIEGESALAWTANELNYKVSIPRTFLPPNVVAFKAVTVQAKDLEKGKQKAVIPLPSRFNFSIYIKSDAL